jgi:hypothetical protein
LIKIRAASFQEISSISSSLIKASTKLAVTDPTIKTPNKEINAVIMAIPPRAVAAGHPLPHAGIAAP